MIFLLNVYKHDCFAMPTLLHDAISNSVERHDIHDSSKHNTVTIYMDINQINLSKDCPPEFVSAVNLEIYQYHAET